MGSQEQSAASEGREKEPDYYASSIWMRGWDETEREMREKARRREESRERSKEEEAKRM